MVALLSAACHSLGVPCRELFRHGAARMHENPPSTDRREACLSGKIVISRVFRTLHTPNRGADSAIGAAPAVMHVAAKTRSDAAFRYALRGFALTQVPLSVILRCSAYTLSLRAVVPLSTYANRGDTLEVSMKKRLVLSALMSAFVLSAIFELSSPQPRLASFHAIQPTTRLSLADLSHTSTVRSEASYLHLPLSFERNQGQTDPQVKFLSRGSGYALYLTPTEALLSLRRPSGNHGLKGRLWALQKSKAHDPAPTLLRMKLVGANPAPVVFGIDELLGKCNYFIGNDPKRWHTNVATFAKVKYENIYPGIDLMYHGNQQQLEYDFVVAPGADPKAIELSFPDAKNLAIDAEGRLVVRLADGEIFERAPSAYQEVNGQKQKVAGRYMLKDANRVAFELGAIDRSRAVVIDPTIVYSTYLGGSGDENPLYMALDRFGDVYLTGFTSS